MSADDEKIRIAKLSGRFKQQTSRSKQPPRLSIMKRTRKVKSTIHRLHLERAKDDRCFFASAN